MEFDNCCGTTCDKALALAEVAALEEEIIDLKVKVASFSRRTEFKLVGGPYAGETLILSKYSTGTMCFTVDGKVGRYISRGKVVTTLYWEPL